MPPCDTLCVCCRQSFGGNHADSYSLLPTHGGVCKPSGLLLCNGGRSPIVVVLIPCAALRVGGRQVICAYHEHRHFGHMVDWQLAILNSPPQVVCCIACTKSLASSDTVQLIRSRRRSCLRLAVTGTSVLHVLCILIPAGSAGQCKQDHVRAHMHRNSHSHCCLWPAMVIAISHLPQAGVLWADNSAPHHPRRVDRRAGPCSPPAPQMTELYCPK